MSNRRKDHDLQRELDLITKELAHLNNALAFKTLDSTNDCALDLEKLGYRSGTIVIASKQLKGRGRLNRQWLMSKGDMALSIILRPPYLPNNLALLPMIPALAIIKALAELNIAVRLKWPNDLIYFTNEESLDYFLHFRKVGGILVENVFRENQLAASIIGLGLNIKPNEILKRNVPHAGCLHDLMPSIDLISCLSRVLCCLDQSILAMGAPSFAIEAFKDYTENCETLGRNIVINADGVSKSGRAIKINADGSLVIDDGVNEHIILAGDVNLS